ncbi:hypothetical protein BDV3_001423 [Batrachochytrium dendrobatidis]
MIEGAIVKSQPILFQLYGFFRNLVNVVYLFFVSLLWPLEDPAPAPKRNDGRSKRPAAKIHGMKSVKS